MEINCECDMDLKDAKTQFIKVVTKILVTTSVIAMGALTWFLFYYYLISVCNRYDKPPAYIIIFIAVLIVSKIARRSFNFIDKKNPIDSRPIQEKD